MKWQSQNQVKITLGHNDQSCASEPEAQLASVLKAYCEHQGPNNTGQDLRMGLGKNNTVYVWTCCAGNIKKHQHLRWPGVAPIIAKGLPTTRNWGSLGNTSNLLSVFSSLMWCQESAYSLIKKGTDSPQNRKGKHWAFLIYHIRALFQLESPPATWTYCSKEAGI